MLLDPESAPPSEESEAPPSSTLARPPVALEPRGERAEPLVFRQGAHPPYGIRWYGVTSLFGHLRNFVARAIATESVDSRDWMRPNGPEEILGAASKVLLPVHLRDKPSPTLVETLGRPVWIDWVADTGDDRDVSAAVGAMLADTYDVADADGSRVLLPRGDLLIFGGDVSYPVATADEIYKRLVLPWNDELRKVGASSRKRVVLGVPGNHDWYDGLDGFGRLFRRRTDDPFTADDHDRTPRIAKRLRQRKGRKVGLAFRAVHLDEVGGLYGLLAGFLRSVRAFFRGVALKRRRRLVLRGYEPVQEASYFVLPLTPSVDLWGGDRQLGRVDFRQRSFFTRRRRQDPTKAVIFCAGDPAMAFGHRNDAGARMLQAVKLNMERDRVLYLAGDFHHYCRHVIKKSMHVVAGGGGAFLHGTRIAPYPKDQGDPVCAYPDAKASRNLVAAVPLKLALGRGGLLVHLALGVLASIEIGAAKDSQRSLVTTSIVISLGLVVALYFVTIQGHDKRKAALLATPFGIALGILPMGLRIALPEIGGFVGHAGDGAILVASAFLGSLIFGFYLMMLNLLGIEHQQAFTALGHPGYKHFVRLCIHPDGKVEAWTIGKDDALAPTPPFLIDQFVWDPGPPPPPPAPSSPEVRRSQRPPR